MTRHTLLRVLNPSHILGFHRKLLFNTVANCGKELKVTHRAEIYVHGADQKQIQIGNYVQIDGIIEVYEKGQIRISDYSFIGRARIYSAHSISIGEFCLISDNVCIMDSDLHPRSAKKRIAIARDWSMGKFPDVYSDIESAPVNLESNCWIGFGSAILKGVTIGEGAIVGAGSIVTKDVPPWTIVTGNPAHMIREIPKHER